MTAVGLRHQPRRPDPASGRQYAELLGGPLDGELLDVTGWGPGDIETGAYVPGGCFLHDRWD
ncbi:hypothetical protein [Streptomyces sp. NPDC002057]|uniref:hypothetical protein n=1 Tax=Streptomyces sp. NPDC002057 TaxID=3154664 RepID=UPI003329BAC0